MKGLTRIRICTALFGALLFFAVWTPAQGAEGANTGAAPPSGRIVRLLEVGTVLTDDGTIWVYRPDRERWMKIDEAFQEQQRRTHILPLPVPVASIKQMATFGFLMTDSGDCWLYLMEKDKWQKLSAPRS